MSLSVFSVWWGGSSHVYALRFLSSNSSDAHRALFDVCCLYHVCSSAQSLRYVCLLLELSFHVASLLCCMYSAIVVCSSDMVRATCFVVALAFVSDGPFFLTTALSGMIADISCRNAVHSVSFAVLL